MELKDLKQDITQMSVSELEALLREMRQSRRTPKKVHVDKHTKTAKPQGAGPDMATLMKSMSPAEMLALLIKNKKD